MANEWSIFEKMTFIFEKAFNYLNWVKMNHIYILVGNIFLRCIFSWFNLAMAWWSNFQSFISYKIFLLVQNLLQVSFFKQFYGSVTKSDYIALRRGFIRVQLSINIALIQTCNFWCKQIFFFYHSSLCVLSTYLAFRLIVPPCLTSIFTLIWWEPSNRTSRK